MPWTTPSLEDLRNTNRDNVQSQLRSGPMIPNSVLRVMADANAGLGFLTLLYIDWLSKQLLPDTAETEWLDRHASIWLSQGRKAATYAHGTITFTSIGSVTMPSGTIVSGAVDSLTNAIIDFSTQSDVVIGTTPTSVSIVATTPGSTGLVGGSTLALKVGIAGINGVGTITSITDGIEEETDDGLRARVLDRIRQPPVGGSAEDYVQWTFATPSVSVTRAWCSPLEMGLGTVTIRFMTDDLANNIVGFPSHADVNLVRDYLDTVRPVAIKDRFVVSPVPEPIDFAITNLSPDSVANRNAVIVAVKKMLFERAAPAHAINGIEQPAQTIYRAWVSEAISSIPTIESFTLIMDDHPMPYPGSLAVLGTVVYG
ncbi:baseplate J/gp47 family protein [Bradyrhizobium japonicum]|uniref:baseplate J/gp47 family protein n=1 Tax=Bradyrhizobium japonicum TaxID=375 RepID=UPI000405E828|nr:baseplate J/gp47 family protein [Bradyrhizobium japonicum]